MTSDRTPTSNSATVVLIEEPFYPPSEMFVGRTICRVTRFSNNIGGRCMATHTGTVKFYRRQQAYGFIILDGERDDIDSSAPAEVFVHRNSINANDDAEGNIYYPFLRQGERVAFDVEDVEGQQRPVAKDLTFADGSIVPTVRPGYAAGYRKGVEQRFGKQLLKMLDENERSGEELLELIHSYHREASEEIGKAVELEKNNNPNYKDVDDKNASE